MACSERRWVAPFTLVAFCVLAGCGGEASLGAPLHGTPTTLVDLERQRADVGAGPWLVTGVVRTVCPSRGCWFELEQEGLARHVDVDPLATWKLDQAWTGRTVQVVVNAHPSQAGLALVAAGISVVPP